MGGFGMDTCVGMMGIFLLCCAHLPEYLVTEKVVNTKYRRNPVVGSTGIHSNDNHFIILASQ